VSGKTITTSLNQSTVIFPFALTSSIILSKLINIPNRIMVIGDIYRTILGNAKGFVVSVA
jgi:hypothetical protein